jgi:small subunit ribosomal protein S2
MSLIDKMTIDGTFENMSKKERLLLTRERAKLEKNLGSITDLTRIPSALFIIDVNKERIAVAEAKKLNIPTFAIVDTNSDPRNIDFIIPGNDDASKSISIIIKIMTQAITEGLNERKIDREKISEIENKKKIENRKNQETDKQEYSGKRKRIKSKVVKFEKKVSEQTKKTEKTLSVTAKKEISDKDSISKKTEENKTT